MAREGLQPNELGGLMTATDITPAEEIYRQALAALSEGIVVARRRPAARSREWPSAAVA